jgi:excinuclease ABC subunit C
MSQVDLIARIKKFPQEPGIYMMRDASDVIIYVGKSKNLKSRVGSYFARTEDLNAAKQSMVEQVATISIVTTQTEIEALVLETNLIKKHRPKYNILMKDDKNLSYIVVGGGPVGEVYRTRQKPSNGTYFGPFTSGANINLTLRALKKIFKVRACRMKFATVKDPSTEDTSWENTQVIITSKAGKTPPCMDYYIGLCPAPCLLTAETLDEHSGNVDGLKKFLRGQMSEVVTHLREQMMERAGRQEFEEAGKIKSQLEAISVLAERQIARDAVRGSYDVISLLDKYDRFWVGVTEIRDSEIQGVFQYELEASLGESRSDLLSFFILSRYSPDIGTETLGEGRTQTHKLLLEYGELSEDVFGFLQSIGIAVEIPAAGSKSEMIDFTKRNILGHAYRTEMDKLTHKTLSKATMVSIFEELGFALPKTGPMSFECYDNSHTNGKFTVASRSVTVNGKAENSLYRKYKLKTLEADKIDDFESMREIMERRTIEWLERDNWPSMILIDGGKWQLSSALTGVERGLFAWAKRSLTQVPEDTKLSSVDEYGESVPLSEWTEQSTANTSLESLVALARTKLPEFAAIAKREEEIFTPGSTTPTLFEQGTPELMLLQQLRDEAHRFAIGFNRGLRSKAMKKNILEELPGFGPVTRKKILKLAGSIEGISALTLPEIESICTPAQVATLKDHGLIASEAA